MEVLGRLVASPLLPPLVLLLGPVALSFAHPTRTRPSHLRWIALSFMLGAFVLLLRIAFLPGVSIFVWEWNPQIQARFQLIWIDMGWNWYVSFLVGILGIVGLLISGRSYGQADSLQSHTQRFYHSRFLSLNLATVAVVWLLVSSANMLSLVYMWVVLDVIIVIRHTLTMNQHEAVQHDYTLVYHRSLGLGILGSLVLLIGLFPAGVNGPSHMLVGTSLPPESLYALFVAAAMRAGAYPLHFWLVPSGMLNLSAAERIFSHILPALTGLWLLGQALDLSQRHPQILTYILPVMALTFGISSLTFLQEQRKSLTDTFVLATGVSLTALSGTLAPEPGVRALLFPLTSFALGSTLWIVAQRLPLDSLGRAMRIVGAASLLGLPLTPGFLSLAYWFPTRIPFREGLVIPALIVGILLLAVGVFRPLSHSQSRTSDSTSPRDGFSVAAVSLAGLILIAGLWPSLIAAMADLQPALSSSLLASTRTFPLPALAVYGTTVLVGAFLSTGVQGWWPINPLAPVCQSIARMLSLEWLSSGIQFGASRLSLVWSNMVTVLEGHGFPGWALILILLLRAALQ